VDRQRCEVIGVAELHGHLYILQNNSKSIRVSLAEKPYSMLSDVLLDGVIEPTDIASSTFDNCIYVTDVGGLGCIWRVQVEERVVESSLEHVELKFEQDESHSTRTESGQGNDKQLDRVTEEMNRTDSREACIAEDDLLEAPVEEDSSVTSVVDCQQQLLGNCGENETREQSTTTQDNACKLQEPISGGLEECRQAGIDLHAFLHAIGRGQVGAADVTHVPEYHKSSPMMKDDDAGETIHSLLQRTGLMQKIAERGNAGPCMFEISRHYIIKRFLFIVDVTVCLVLHDV